MLFYPPTRLRSPSHILIGSSGILFNTCRRSKLDRPGLAAAGVELIKFQVHRHNRSHPRLLAQRGDGNFPIPVELQNWDYQFICAAKECRFDNVKTYKTPAESAIDCLFVCKSHPPNLAKAQFL